MSNRSIYCIELLIICLILAGSVYLQLVDGILPCPLCTLQRLTFGLLGVFSLIGILLHARRWGRLLTNIFLILTAILGMTLAGRQVWLQQFHANSTSECGVGLNYMLQVLPLNEVMQKVFAGGSECTQRGWEFLFLNMAEWAFIWFTGFALLGIYLLVKEFKTKSFH